MIFRRSTSSLYSIHIFFQVDSVVFCEGGLSLTYGDAIQHVEAHATLDTYYWAALVSTYSLPKTFHFKSVGSKDTIKAIADEVSRHNIPNVTVCRDSDYDVLLGNAIQGEHVAWTFGYSWENDVVRLPVLEAMAEALVGPGTHRTAMIEKLRENVSQLSVDFQRWTEIDISLNSRKRGCIFDRVKPMSSLDMAAPPALRTGFLQQRLATAGYRRKPRRVVALPTEEVPTRCFGKLVGKALYHAFVTELRNHIEVRLDYEVFMRLAIAETIRTLLRGELPDFATHVSAQRDAFA